MSKLPKIIAATGIHRPVLQQESCVSAATPHITHLLPVKEFTFSWLNHNLFINPTQAQLSIGSISPAQHCSSPFSCTQKQDLRLCEEDTWANITFQSIVTYPPFHLQGVI